MPWGTVRFIDGRINRRAMRRPSSRGVSFETSYASTTTATARTTR